MFKKYLIPKTLFVLLCLVGSLRSSAQGELQFGIQLSPAFSTMRTNDNLINSDGSNLGLKVGLIAEYYFQENYSIHTGFGFHLNGGGTLFYEDEFQAVRIWNESLGEAFNQVPDSLAGGTAFKYDINLLEIPLGLTLRTRQFGYITYFARPQLNLGFVTGSNGSVENVSTIDSEEEFDIGEEVNGINLGWGIGGGIEYAVSDQTALIAGLAYHSGFSDLTRDKGTQVRRRGRNPREDDSKGTIGSFVITLGVMF